MDALIAKADAVLQKRPQSRRKVEAKRFNKLPVQPKAGSSSQANGEDSGKKKSKENDKGKEKAQQADATVQSIMAHTTLPRSLRPTEPLDSKQTRKATSYAHIPNARLRLSLTRTVEQTQRARHDAQELTEEILSKVASGGTGDGSRGGGGLIEAEGELERSWRVTQKEIVESVGAEAAGGRREWSLDGGPYRVRYSRNGRHLAIVGKMGHVASFDWKAGAMHAELQLKETCRDITYLHDHTHFAVAQKKYVFMYDQNGVELHKMASHIEPLRLEFLPYHFLLASIGLTGVLTYQDTSTGSIVAMHKTKGNGAGNSLSMCQNKHNAIIYLGHSNGTVSLWSPNMSESVVRVLAHRGGVKSVVVDESVAGGGMNGGRYMATAGLDGMVKVWDCRNWKGCVREWSARGGAAELDWSAKGVLAVASGGTVNLYTAPSLYTSPRARSQSEKHPIPQLPPALYLTHPIPKRPLTSVRFCPFEDILSVGHSGGVSSILVPGSGEPNYDSYEADPFENKRARREREVKALLDKIPADMIALDADFVGSLETPKPLTLPGGVVPDVPFARLPRMERLKVSGKLDQSEEVDSDEGEDVDMDDENGKRLTEDDRKAAKEKKEKKKMRGKGKSLKRYLRKQRKNVIDPTAVALRAKLEKQREERRKAAASVTEDVEKKTSALDRFKRT